MKFDSEGDFVREFGSTGGGEGELEQPESVEIDGEGRVWVADQGNARVQGFDEQGEYVKQFGSQGAGPGEFRHPTGLAADEVGRIWVVDSSEGHNASAPGEPTEPRDGLLAAYSFDEGEGEVAHDATGHHDGSVEGASWTEGRFGNALSFDGETGCVAVPSGVDLQLGEAFTLEAWARPTIDTGYGPIFFKDADSFYSYSLWVGGLNAGHLEGYVADEPWEWSEVASSGALPAKTWSHVALTSDRATLRLYLNGELIDSASAKEVMESEGPLHIGCGVALGGPHFYGKIDEVRIYNRALSEGEIGEDEAIPVSDPAGGDRVQRWLIGGSALSFDTAFGSHGSNDGKFDGAADITIALVGCVAAPCEGQIAESFVYDPAAWGLGPHTVTVTGMDNTGNVDVEEVRVNEPLNVVAPQCPSAEPETLSGGEERSAQEVVADIEETIPAALEPSEEASGAPLDPSVTTQPVGVSLNEMGIDVVATEAGGGIEDDIGGSFTVGQAACLQPLELSSMAGKPVIVNDTSVVYPNSAPDTDTVIRPTAVGTTIIERPRGEEAPGEFSWKVALEPGEELVELENGGIAVVDPEGVDFDPEGEVPTAPEAGSAALTDAEAQLELAEHDVLAANEEIEGSVSLVVSPPELVDGSEEVVPGLLRITGAKVITAELPPNAVAEIEAMIIRLSPPAEPESMCASVVARTPQYASQVCGAESDDDGDETDEGPVPDYSLQGMASTPNAALNAVLLGEAMSVEALLASEGAHASESGDSGATETPEQKRYCKKEKEKHRAECVRFREVGAYTAAAEDDLFNNSDADNTMANAFRHSLWTA